MNSPETAERRNILVLTHFYTPGFRGGGPITSVRNIARALGNWHNYYILTLDRDLGSGQPYADIRVNQWQQLENARVFYVRKSWLSWWTIGRILTAGRFDLVYLNSFFNPLFSIWPTMVLKLAMWFGLNKIQILLAPRGEFSPGALEIHATRKFYFLLCAEFLGLYRNVIWHASSAFEASDILNAIGRGVVKIGAPVADRHRIITALDLVDPGDGLGGGDGTVAEREKHRGKCVIGFVSRISPKKNLDFALEVLAGVRGEVQFEIYGPVEDRGYWKMCRRLIDRLPANIVVRWHGELPHEKIPEAMRALHLFLLPTRGENFGHVINEALCAGCPVLISDLTPWRNLAAAGVGWDLSLVDMQPFRSAIEEVIAMDQERFHALSGTAARYAQSAPLAADAVEQNRRMFEECLQARTRL